MSKTGRNTVIAVAGAVVLALGAWGGVWAADAGPKVARLNARWACPCVFIENRGLKECVASVPLELASLPVSVEQDSSRRTVTATALYIFRSEARHYPKSGCVLER